MRKKKITYYAALAATAVLSYAAVKGLVLSK